MFSMQHTLLTVCYANMLCVCGFVDVCVVSVTLSLSSCPLLLSSAGWLVIRWREVECDSVIIRADMCRWPRDVPACWEFWGNSAVSHSHSSPLFFFCYKYSSGHMLPQFTAELMVFVRATHQGSGCVKVIWSSALEASLPGSQSDSGAARCDAGSPAGVWRSGASLTAGLTDFIWHKQELLPSWEICIHATNLKTNKDNYFSPTVFVFLY